MTLNSPAPAAVIKLVKCNCKKGCSKGCSCRKSILACTEMCGCIDFDCQHTYNIEINAGCTSCDDDEEN